MRQRSLRWRLILSGALAISASLLLSAIGLDYLFERHVERVSIADLEARALSVTAMVEPGRSAEAKFRDAPVDPLYDQPFSGHYWQIELADDIRRSRSLWDYVLPGPVTTPNRGDSRIVAMTGPQGEALLALERFLEVSSAGQLLPLRIVVAKDRKELERANIGFLADLIPFLGLLGGLLLAASWMQVSVGLKPLSQVSSRIAGLRSGQISRVGVDLPEEVLPLAREIDQLLDARDNELERARHRAANLAHGFKSPLQALFGDAEQLRERNEDEIADNIEATAAVMRMVVEKELARSRIQSDRLAAEADASQAVEQVIEVLRRTPMGASVAWRITAPSSVKIRIDSSDLTEAVGALIENAVRHAAGRVDVAVKEKDSWVEIEVLDDGPGVPESQLEQLVQRGVRLDERADGHGIGLSIVSEIAEAAQGSLSLNNTTGGFRATLRLRGVNA